LTDIEYMIIKTHPEVGAEILGSVRLPWPLDRIVFQHHERLNGSGYPKGLRGDAIMVEARVLAVADVVEAMFSHRPYRPSLGIERALHEVRSKAGSLYDSQVVEACCALFDEGFVFLPEAPSFSPP
jgi:HD-GYP domain-containing protein (c-di-GMP phosphodiesterase class II)